MCCRTAPRPFAWHRRDTELPSGYQRARLRRLRRLRRRQQLPVSATRRHPVWTKDTHPSGQLQLRLLMHEGRLSVIRYRRTGRVGQRTTVTSVAADRHCQPICSDRQRRCVHGPPDRHRWHGSDHCQPDCGNRSDARRPHRARPRPNRPLTEGRPGRERPDHHDRCRTGFEPRQRIRHRHDPRV